MKQLICGDNLDVLKSGAIDTASVDVVYLDPPFNSNQYYNLPFTILGKDAAAVEAFKDIWSWDEATHDLERRLKSERDTIALSTYINDVKMIRGGEDSLSAYLVNMAIRLNEIKRVMKSTATMYLHCDQTASHYLKLLLDGIFGPVCFRNEIIWKRSNPKSHGSVNLATCTDTILRYSKGAKVVFHQTYEMHDPAYVAKAYKYRDDGGEYRLLPLLNPNDDRPNLTYEFLGVTRVWRWTRERMERAYEGGLVVQLKPGAVPQYKKYLHDSAGRTITNCSTDIQQAAGNASLGYPTQKPVALLERIISLSSNEGDTVLDPFCGCGTTLHAAEALHRNWIGIDVSRFCVGVVKNRLAESFEKDILKHITVSGIPTNVESAYALAHDNPWEFEKWACGQIGAKGLYKRPGAKGTDGGIDGVVEFYADPANKSYAIVQVKGGGVKPNDVKALYSDVEREPLAAAGVFVCFERFREMAIRHAETA